MSISFMVFHKVHCLRESKLVFKTPYEPSFRKEEEKSQETASTDKVKVIVPVCLKTSRGSFVGNPSQTSPNSRIHPIWQNFHNS